MYFFVLDAISNLNDDINDYRIDAISNLNFGHDDINDYRMDAISNLNFEHDDINDYRINAHCYLTILLFHGYLTISCKIGIIYGNIDVNFFS